MLLQWPTRRDRASYSLELKGAVFAICYCVMIDSKTIPLSQNCLFICRLGIWAGSAGSSASGSLRGCSHGVSQDCGHLKAQEGKEPMVHVRSKSLGFSSHARGQEYLKS